ncbi:ABC-2 type transport system ATP-binding protein [Paenibacillus catalpae]|uniref:ABC-2 type transport system ATP-binding protein n=1 Tax=Paenibacillus catalpae TaxID=1045775 RepID=A0A1I1YR89_9BACL|nr:ABC transporter ATP-binding protein [Paenibacillus catalpae]SFE22037.1 ABC-2 type transport system ATP-binding protein [Paenibacillus catalpae]
MHIVDIHHLTKYYKKDRGIIDISFSIDEGEIFGFIGPNGAGKSTTIRTLLNFIHPTEGRATIFGKDVVRHSKEIRRNVGYLPSEVHYYDDMKVIDLLLYSLKFYPKGDIHRIHELSSQLELDLHRKIEDLSFGNRKKVGIVQALLHSPKLLILDEPTSGLDPLMQQVFFRMLEDERRKGTTIFFSSHVLSEVRNLCDRVAIVKEGQLIKVESIESLMKNQLRSVILTIDHPEHVSLNINGIVKCEIRGNEIQLLYGGDIRELLNAINVLAYQDIRIEEPSLDEIFMHYYKQEGEKTNDL